MSKLSDEELSSLDQWAACDLGETEGNEVAALITELRALRALLATPMPCGWPVPEASAHQWRSLDADGNADPDTPCVHWESMPLGTHMDPDEAIALGAALIRAALAAQKGGA